MSLNHFKRLNAALLCLASICTYAHADTIKDKGNDQDLAQFSQFAALFTSHTGKVIDTNVDRFGNDDEFNVNNFTCSGKATEFCSGKSDDSQKSQSEDAFPFDFLIDLPSGVQLCTKSGEEDLKVVYEPIFGHHRDRDSDEDLDDRKFAPVPEPPTLLLLSTALLGFGLMWRRQLLGN